MIIGKELKSLAISYNKKGCPVEQPFKNGITDLLLFHF